jgi:hypothetical protein
MRLLPYTIWNQFFCGIFLHLGEFFSKQREKKRKEKEKKRKRKNDNFDVFLEFFKKPKRNLLDLDLGRQMQQETKRRRE